MAELFEVFYLVAMDTLASGLGPLHRALASPPPHAGGSSGPAAQAFSHEILRCAFTSVAAAAAAVVAVAAAETR